MDSFGWTVFARARSAEAVRARWTRMDGALKRRRLPGSVLAAAKPPEAKKRGRRKAAEADDETNAREAERAREAEPAPYDVVSDSDGDVGAVGRADGDARRTAGTSGDRRGVALTANQLESVKCVTDEALVRAARFYCGELAQARALAKPPEPTRASEVTRDASVEADVHARPPPKARSPADPPARPLTSTSASLPVETFDDMFSMFTGASKPTMTPKMTPSVAPARPVSRESVVDVYIDASRDRDRAPVAADRTARASAKPKISFAALMADAPPEDEDSE